MQLTRMVTGFAAEHEPWLDMVAESRIACYFGLDDMGQELARQIGFAYDIALAPADLQPRGNPPRSFALLPDSIWQDVFKT